MDADRQDVFRAVADPRRRGLLGALARQGSATATELAQGLPISRQAVLKHLAQLEEAGLVRSSRSGREVRFLPIPEPLAEVTAWVERVSDRWRMRLEKMRLFVEAKEVQGEADRSTGRGPDVRARPPGARLRRVRDGRRTRRVVHTRRGGRR